MERDYSLADTVDSHKNFNSHAHVERDDGWYYLPMDTSDFNSHAHVERDFNAHAMKLLSLWISTHTLTWSVTLDVVYIWCLLNVMRTYFFI